MKAIDYLSSLIAGQKMGSSIPVQVCELEMLKTYLEIQQTMAEGRAALANAEQVESEDGCAPNHMCNGHRVHIPTGECCNKCGATSW